MGIFSLFRQLKWARRIAAIMVGLLFLAIVLGVLALLNLDRVVKTAIERGGGIVLDVPVSVGEVDVSLWSGKAEVKNLQMGSPEGYDSEHMLKLDRGYIEMEFRSLFGDEIVIHNVELEKPDVMWELGGEHGSNWQALMARLRTADEEAARKPVRVGRVVIDDTHLRVSGGGLLTDNPLVRNRAVVLPLLEVDEFSTGEDSTLTVAEALYDLVRQLVVAIGQKLGGAGVDLDALRSIPDEGSTP